MAKEIAPKIILEREYIVPLRKEWLKVPEYKRANKAVKALKEFVAQHMKVYDRDLRKIKVEKYLNNEIRFRGMRKPPARIKVIARKYDSGIVRVDLVDFPEHIKFEKMRLEKRSKVVEKKVPEKKTTPKNEEIKEETEETKELEQTSKEAEMKISKEQAKEEKHTAKEKQVKVNRKSLSK